MPSSPFAPLLVAGILTAASGAGADCCRVIKIDAELSPATVRVCETSPSGLCEALLFEGTLALGESQEVCAATGTVLYQELDPDTQTWLDPVAALCAGNDVEL